MDNVIKLPAQQALFNAKNRLVDLVLPADSGVYDLSKCYVAIDVAVPGLSLDTTQAGAGRLPRTAGYVEAADAVADVRLGLKHNATTKTIYDDCAIPVEALVRNCSMMSSTKGKVEDIRRADVLRATMKAYTDDIEEVEARSIGGFGGPQAKTNPWASGRFAVMVGVGDTASAYKSHEVRIMLKDLFSIAQAESWDTSSSAYGALHIHMELNLDRVELKQTLGSTPDVWDRYYHNQQVGTISGPADIKYKTAETVTLPISANTVSQSSITMKAVYQSLEDSPFYNNQMVKITTTLGGGTAATPYPTSGDQRWAVIKSISWDKTTKQVTLEFGGEILATGAVTGSDVTVDRDVVGIDVNTLTDIISYQSVELTAVRRADMESGPSQTQYTQIQTQSDQWQNSENLNRSYYLPPQTTNAYIILPSRSNAGAAPTAFSDILGCARVGEYRFTINGESVTNRAVPFMPVPVAVAANDGKNLHGSSIHYTLISETMMNAGVRFNSLREAVFDQNIPLSINVPINGNGEYGWTALKDAPMKACYMLALPIPISNDQTQLTIELEGSFPASSGELHIFSQVRSVV